MAIKTSFGAAYTERKMADTIRSSKNIRILLEEAKTMLKAGIYQENIVNLHGVVVDTQDNSIKEVINPLVYDSILVR